MVSGGLNFESSLTAGASHSEALGNMKGTKSSSSVLSTWKHLPVLALRGILTCALGLGHQGTHNPALFAEFEAWTRVCPFLWVLQAAVEFCYRVALRPREEKLLVSGQAWRNLAGKVVCGLMEHHGWLGGLEAAGQCAQGCSILPLPGRGC